MSQMYEYIQKALSRTGISIGTILSIINFIFFPDKAYAYAAFALGGAVLVDIFSKYVALSKNSGGWRRAFRLGKIFSKSLWHGTKVKLQAYLAISIMVGLSYRLNSLPGAFTSVSLFMATVVYTILFLREFQSILENFRDAGAKNVEWLLFWAKDREKEFFEKNNLRLEKESNEQKEIDLDRFI